MGTNDTTATRPTPGPGGAHHDNRDMVEVIIDGTPVKVEQGTYVVSDLKAKLGVDPSKELEQVVEGKLVPLSDSGTIDLSKAAVRLVSHVRRGGSS